jgi:hypothetical protein
LPGDEELNDHEGQASHQYELLFPVEITHVDSPAALLARDLVSLFERQNDSKQQYSFRARPQ